MDTPCIITYIYIEDVVGEVNCVFLTTMSHEIHKIIPQKVLSTQ